MVKMNSGMLTIDDIASKITPAIVDYLNEKGICAILFAVGQNIEKYYDEAIYAKKGTIIGNHSYTRPAFSELSMTECAEEIERCENTIHKLYSDAGVERLYKPFRFPYGNKGGKNKEALQNYLKKHDFHKVADEQISYPWWSENDLDKDIDTFWTFDFGEFYIRLGSDFTKESVFERMPDKNPNSGAILFVENNHHIILMHAYDETETMLPEYYKLLIEANAGKVERAIEEVASRCAEESGYIAVLEETV